MCDLLKYLESIQPGSISDTTKLEQILSACWDEFDGGNDGGMAGYKLHGRMEDATWSPPTLSFIIERHGATVNGSSRAELQKWELNIENKRTVCCEVGRRQVRPIQPRLDVRPIAKEVVQLILNQQEDERLKWHENGSVRI